MKIIVDLNVVLDVVQNRVPHYAASAAVLSRARTREFEAVLPSHAITTIHYLVAKARDRSAADLAVDMLLQYFGIVAADKRIFLAARQLKFRDFEDAAVVSMAQASASDYVVTRNVQDFAASPVPAIAPIDFLELLPQAPISA